MFHFSNISEMHAWPFSTVVYLIRSEGLYFFAVAIRLFPLRNIAAK